MMRSLFGFIITAFLAATAYAQPASFPAPAEGDYVARDFAFASGERINEITIHYRTRQDADGVVRNGVLILHGTGGSGGGFLGAS